MRALTALLLLTVGCASAGERSTEAGNVLTLEEIRRSSQADAYGVILDLRTQWLRVGRRVSFSGPSPIVIYVDGARAGGLELLESIPVEIIEEIRYYQASEARARFGVRDGRPVIALRTSGG